MIAKKCLRTYLRPYHNSSQKGKSMEYLIVCIEANQHQKVSWFLQIDKKKFLAILETLESTNITLKFFTFQNQGNTPKNRIAESSKIVTNSWRKLK